VFGSLLIIRVQDHTHTEHAGPTMASMQTRTVTLHVLTQSLTELL
jgi:hypothetical protein